MSAQSIGYENMMRVIVALCCSIFPLHLLLCVHSLPVLERKTSNRYKEAAGGPQRNHHLDLKKRLRRLGQDTLLKNQYHLSGLIPPPGNGTEFWNRPRCGVPSYAKQMGMSDYLTQKERPLNGRQRKKRYVLFGGRWNKTDLTYKIMRFPWQMRKDKVRRIFQEALRVWSDVTPLRFSEVTTGKADIIIDFARYWHGDKLPFDGPGGILAHAYFPRTHREGDIHFDFDENWTVGNSIGTDLLQVAAHEFGHVLGLQHSLVPGAVMSPFYTFSYPLQLSEDDKRGIQYLYGPPREVTPHIPETNEIDTGVPDVCRTNFDAVSMIRGELFFFKSSYVWRIRNGHLQEGYPALASRHWRGIPDYIDAAYEDKSGNIWFFQGDSYWVFDAERKITGPDSVQRLGLPVSDIQAAVKLGEDQGQKVYLFKSGTYWHFNPQENRVDASHPHNMQDWRGLPSNIDAAFQDRYGYPHFLSGLQYWKFDPVEVKVLEGYPRNIGMDFFGCATSPYQ